MMTARPALLDWRGMAIAAAMIAALASVAPAGAQCVQTWEWVGGLTGKVYSLEVFDAGAENEDGVTNQDDLDLILFTFGGPCVGR